MKKILIITNLLFVSGLVSGMQNLPSRTQSPTASQCEWFDNIKNKQYEQIKSQIDFHLDDQNENGETALILSVKNGDETLTKILLNSFANIHIKDNSQKNAIDWINYLVKSKTKKPGSTKSYKRIKNLLMQAESNLSSRSIPLSEDVFETMYSLLRNNNVKQLELLLSQAPEAINHKFKTDKHSMLIYAVRRGSDFKKMLKMLLKQNNVNAGLQDTSGYTPLMFAVEDKYHDAVNELIRRNDCNINAVDILNNTALLLATYNNDVDSVRALLTKDDIDINVPNKKDVTPLKFALEHNYLEIANLLLDRGDQIKPSLSDSKFGGQTLIDAVRRNHNDEVEKMLQICDQHVNFKDEAGCTPLIYAVAENNKNIVELLLNHRANPNLQNETGYNALSMALLLGFEDIVELLLEKHQNRELTININEGTTHGINPLMMAATFGRYKIVDYLINLPDIQVNKIDWAGYTALRRAIFTGYEDIIELILKKYNSDMLMKEINRKDWLGYTLWETAIASENKKILTLLLDLLPETAEKAKKVEELNNLFQKETQAIEIIEQENKPKTKEERNKIINQSFLEAVSKGSIDVKTLFNSTDSNGNRIITMDTINEALKLACTTGNSEILNLILTRRPNINLKDNEGNSPLMLAAKHGNLHVIPSLLFNGAAINTKNREGLTALMLAAKNTHIDIVKLLAKKFKAKLFKDQLFDLIQNEVKAIKKKKFVSNIDKEKIKDYEAIEDFLTSIQKRTEVNSIDTNTQRNNWSVFLSNSSNKQLKSLIQTNKPIYDKLQTALKLLSFNPFDNTWGSPRKLESGLWYRKLNNKHRIVYDINGEEILIVSCSDHYPENENKKSKRDILKGVVFDIPFNQ